LLAIARAVVGTRASPEDVVQQAITNLFQHRERYDWHEPGGLLKRRRRERGAADPAAAEDVDGAGRSPDGRDDDDPASGMLENETVRRVRAAIDKLPEHYRSALVLCEYDNMPYAEIATTLGASVPQVKTWIFRAGGNWRRC
jgi:RNA polymerase sigma-70 factor (ECF subfamily)